MDVPGVVPQILSDAGNKGDDIVPGDSLYLFNTPHRESGIFPDVVDALWWDLSELRPCFARRNLYIEPFLVPVFIRPDMCEFFSCISWYHLFFPLLSIM